MMTINRRSFGLTCLVSLAYATQGQAQKQIQNQSQLKRRRLVEAAREQTQAQVIYDSQYRKIPYPNGDVPAQFGVCTDVIIRAYRKALNVDLQSLVHQDMCAHFALYPKAWGLKAPDPNIDHRRVPNLSTFFKRHGQSLSLTKIPSYFLAGDLVTYRLPMGQPHIAMVSDAIQQADLFNREPRPLIIHNIGAGPKEENALLAYEITGHYRFGI